MSRLNGTRIAFVLGAGALLAGLYFARSGQSPAPEVAPAAPSPDTAVEATPLTDQRETRRLAMQVAYADLEKDRLLLNRQLGSLNASLWDRRLSATRAKAVQDDMMSAKALLTNPPLLGAFTDAAGIRHERDRVNAALARLQALEAELRAENGN